LKMATQNICCFAHARAGDFLSVEPGYDFTNKVGALYIGITSNKFYR